MTFGQMLRELAVEHGMKSGDPEKDKCAYRLADSLIQGFAGREIPPGEEDFWKAKALLALKKVNAQSLEQCERTIRDQTSKN